ncbi:MAG: hypothetical protein QF890_00575 [Myxococcota bacterium]|nr:hypothetical protein [Deltaproteobacteria bacterium]MCP4239927.1 hypothetical protein [bacterium]MDP6073952.1 hypothetical protein [Myxococcota bacterium]MBT39962.1 hypothetical protein [Deltaproteobacteria bacterium]MDP6241863.1 hypothetical protein [Myxococcota bacterium]
MEESLPLFPTPDEVGSRYAVCPLVDVRPEADGLRHREGLLSWGAILRAHVAEVGEPQGPCAVVFDLVIGREGTSWQVLRFGIEPGDEAAELGRQLTAALPPRCLAASIKSLTADGSPGEWHSDLASLDESSLVALTAAFD